MTIEHPSILLVGASSEIGGAIIDALLAERPGTAVLAGRPSPRRAGAVARLREAGHEVMVLDYDAAFSEAQTAELLQRATEVTGALDAVVVAVGSMGSSRHDPGSPGGASLPSQIPAPGEPNLHRLLTTNLLGPALVANAAATVLSAQGHGVLAVVTSAAAVRPRQQILGYACAKQSLDTFVRGLDRRTRPLGARCIVVRPGQVRTRMTAGLPPALLTTDPSHVGQRVKKAMDAPRGVIWSPRLMGPAMAVLACLPRLAIPKGLR
ncbi:MAG: SDR family NAD(P)-dependent oxidoreductase [Terracoccus sp.]